MSDQNDESGLFSNVCDYCDLTTLPSPLLANSVMHLNIRSLQGKVSELEIFLKMCSYPRILLLSETWLNDKYMLPHIPNYTFISSPRTSGKGGGVGIYLHNSVQYSITDKSCNHKLLYNIDYILIDLMQFNLALCCLYCPPKTEVTDVIKVISLLKLKSNCKRPFIAAGDFNINLLEESNNFNADFVNDLLSYSLHPVITLPTRVTDSSATLIDNFLCDFSLLPMQACVIRYDISDHYPIALYLNDNELNQKCNTTTIRALSAKNKTEFSRRLSTIDWNHLYSINDVNKAYGYFAKKLKRIYNKSFPHLTINKHNQNAPWITAGILKSIKRKNKLYHLSKRNSDHKLLYITYKNRLCKIIREAKIQYHRNLLLTYKNRSRKMWMHLNSLIKTKEKAEIPLSPNTLNDFFSSVYKQAPSLRDNTPFTMPNKSFVSDAFFLRPLTNDEVLNAMTCLSNSQAVGSDGFNLLVLKENFSFISKQLTYIFNLSFSSGVFPSLLKNAIVTPVFKAGSSTEPGNYRPISILTTFSKLLEKLFYIRLISFINSHNILNPHQFGFRANYSTNLAIAHVLSNIISIVNHKNRAVIALLDLKKAFDLINHKLLLKKLYHYGIRGLPLNWLASYLSSRSQKTKVNNKLSDKNLISAGVPQGSILGPLLFILFVNDVFQLSSIHIDIYLYADDTVIIFRGDDEAMLQSRVDAFFIKYCDWCNYNCIVLNPAKSNFLSFNCNNIHIIINDEMLMNATIAKYLGIYIDNNLLWSYHVNYFYKLCCQRIGMFKKVLPYLPHYVVLLYYNAFIVSSFSYATMFWFNNNRSGRYKLVNKINNLISTLALSSNLDVKTFCINLGVCNVNDVYTLQCLSLMHDICYNVIDLPHFEFAMNSVVHSHDTRAANNVHINTVNSLDQRNFMYHCLLFWNNYSSKYRTSCKKAFLSTCKKLLIESNFA